MISLELRCHAVINGAVSPANHEQQRKCTSLFAYYQIKSNQIYLLAHKHTLQETINVKQNEN